MSALLLVLTLGVGGCGSNAPRLEPIRIADDSHSGGNALDVSPDSRLGASSGWAGRIRLWRLPEGSPAASWQTSHGDLPGLMFLADGKQLLSAGRDGLVRIWDLKGQLIASYDTGASVTSFHPSHDRRHVLTGHVNGMVSLWSVEGERLGSWKLSNRRITAVASNGSLTRYAAGDGGRRVWRWDENGLPRQLQSPPTHVRSLTFNPADAGLLGSGWFDLFSWPENTSQLQVIPTDHGGIVNHLAFSADGSYVASISRQTDSAVLLLNPHTGKTLVAFRKHALCGQRVALSPDGRNLISNSDDASVRFYALPPSLSDNPAARNP